MRTFALYLATLSFACAASAAQLELTAPPGSVDFGGNVLVLPNGNIVVVDGNASGVATDNGAVHLFSASGTLISSLTGSQAFDQVGAWGVTVLANGNFVVRSRSWSNGSAADAGAVTFVNATTGRSGAVSSANSLVGSRSGDLVGTVVALANGNYLVLSSSWDNGAANPDAGAVTWCSGTTGCTGAVSVANSLIGGSASQHIGGSALALKNGHAVIASPGWDNGAQLNAGAVTWINGNSGMLGTVTAANSWVANTGGSQLGNGGLVELSDGNVVIVSHWFADGVSTNLGAVTWVNGAAATSGVVSVANSLVGAVPGDSVGSGRVFALHNGRYVVASGRVDLGGVEDVGAVTWMNGGGPYSGTVTAANSLHGSTHWDRVGEDGIGVLANGHYVVRSNAWDNTAAAAVNAGALTWGNGNSATTGPVTPVNSLVGGKTDDRVGYPYPLSNGHYVAYSQFWDNGLSVDAAAFTWCNGNTGCSGLITPANSLVGSATDSRVGGRFAALSNGNYVIGSRDWDNGSTLNVGAATWASGTSGISGTVSAANSFIGVTTDDHVGEFVEALADGSYLIGSRDFDNGGTVDAGALTRRPGDIASVGSVSAANSLVGAQANGRLGGDNIDALPDGRYIMQSSEIDNGMIVDAGMFSLIPLGGLVGPVPVANSIIGTVQDEGTAMYFDYDLQRGRVVVGHGPANRVVLMSLDPDERKIFGNSFE